MNNHQFLLINIGARYFLVLINIFRLFFEKKYLSNILYKVGRERKQDLLDTLGAGKYYILQTNVLK